MASIANNDRRRPLPAISWGVQYNELRRQFLNCYLQDVIFREDCLAIARDHRSAIIEVDESPRWWAYWRGDPKGEVPADVAAYFEALRSHLAVCKLTPLGDWARHIVHGWIASKSFHDVQNIHMLVTPEPDDIAVTVQVNDSWFPGAESLNDARQRLLYECRAQIDSELDRISCHFEKHYWTFAREELVDNPHVYWLFLRLVKGMTPKRISTTKDAAGYSEKTIYNQTKYLADQIGLSFS